MHPTVSKVLLPLTLRRHVTVENRKLHLCVSTYNLSPLTFREQSSRETGNHPDDNFIFLKVHFRFQTNPQLGPNLSQFNAVRFLASRFFKMQMGQTGAVLLQVPPTAFSSQIIFRLYIMMKLLKSVTKRNA